MCPPPGGVDEKQQPALGQQLVLPHCSSQRCKELVTAATGDSVGRKAFSFISALQLQNPCAWILLKSAHASLESKILSNY